MHWNLLRPTTATSHNGISFLIVSLLIFGIVGSAGAFQRKPLFEDFTSTTCPPCAQLAPIQAAALETLQEDDEVVVIAYHMNWPAPGNDPWYADNPTDNGNPGRRGYYGVNGVPTIYIDGSVSNARSTDAIISAVRNRANTASPISISLNARIVGGELIATVHIEAEQAVNNARLYIGLNEIYYRYDAYGEWWDHYDAMVKMVPDYNGTVISVSPDNPYDHEFRNSMDGLGWHDLEIDNLNLVAFVQEGNHNVIQAEHFMLGIDSPAIDIVEWNVSDDTNSGDGDGRAEPGETVNFTFGIENAANYLPAETVDATLTTEDAGITIDQGDFHLDGMPNGAKRTNNQEPFTFTVADDFVAHPVTFTLSIVATPGDFMIEQDFTFMVDWPPFLLVDAASNNNASNNMLSAFARNGMPWYDRWNRDVEGPMMDDALLSQYDVVFWYTLNNQADAIIEFEADALVNYLDQGGTLVISSAYLPGQLGNHPLATRYLCMEVDQANAGGSSNYIVGVEGDPHFDGTNAFLGGAAGFPTARMSFTLNNNVEAVLRYEDSGRADRGVAAIKHEAGTYRTLLLGFPPETITGAARTDSLITFTNRIWEWVQNPPVSAPNDEIIPDLFSLSAAYPNPFNSQTIINYSLATSGDATLKLFDIAGREVAELFNGSLVAGRHTASLNASDIGLESGVYYLRLDAGENTATSKLVYIK